MEVKPGTSSLQGKAAETTYSPQTLSATLNAFRVTGEFCDVKLKVDGVEYPAHKMILSAFSPYFKGMFSGDFSEAKESLVCLATIDASVIRIILEYAYTATIVITEKNVKALLLTANYLQAVPLFEMCSRFLENNLKVGNCLDLWSFGEANICSSLQEKAKQFVLEHFEEVSKEKDFLRLELDQLITIVGNDALNVENEDIVFHSVIQWMHHKEEERLQVLDQVLCQVRVAHCTPYFLKDYLQTEKAVRKSVACMRLVEKARDYLACASRRMETHSSITRRRLSSSHVEAMGIYFKLPEDKFDSIFFLTEDGCMLEKLIPPSNTPSPLLYFTPQCDKLMAHFEPFASSWIYDYNAQIWFRTAPPLSRGRIEIGVVELDGYWYAVGGQDAWCGAVNDVERYDFSTNSWKLVAPLPKSVRNPAVVCLEGLMYVLGNTSQCEVPVFQRYTPRTNEWSELESLPSTCSNLTACALNGRIYVCLMENITVYVYDVSISKWDRAADMKHPLVSGPVVLNGKVFALTNKRPSDARIIEQYSPSTDSWKSFFTFPDVKPHFMRGPFLLRSNRKRAKRIKCVPCSDLTEERNEDVN